MRRIENSQAPNSKVRKLIFFVTFCVIGFGSLNTFSSSSRRVTTATGLSTLQKSVPPEWKPYLDPSKDEFWKEGNHIPDQGFTLWAKNPTVENAKLFLIRMNIKRNLLHKMYEQQKQANFELIREGIIEDDYDFLSKEIGQKSPVKPNLLRELADTHIFFFFSPNCIHSRRQAEVLKGLENVTPLQIGGANLYHFKDLPNSSWAEKEDLAKHKIDGKVPSLLIYNNKNNKMFRAVGFQTIEAISTISRGLKQ